MELTVGIVLLAMITLFVGCGSMPCSGERANSSR